MLALSSQPRAGPLTQAALEGDLGGQFSSLPPAETQAPVSEEDGLRVIGCSFWSTPGLPFGWRVAWVSPRESKGRASEDPCLSFPSPECNRRP